jgi:hypothetical protein
VLLTIVAVTVLCAIELAHALALYDWRADQNAARTYLDREYGEPFDIVGSQKVVAAANLWMPEDASYRVLTGPNGVGGDGVAPELRRAFLRFLLLPRRQTTSPTAAWVICAGCDRSALGPRFQVLSRGGEAMVFGRMRR